MPYLAALRAVVRCSASTARLLRQHRLLLPARWVGTQLRFADGTSARVYRETVADRRATLDPCVLVVEFRLRAVRGLRHAAGRELRASPVAGARPGVGAGLDHYVVLPGLRCDEMLDRLHLLGGDDAWWRLTSVGMSAVG